jgi:DNA repair protein RecO (recombination protein O)
MVIKTRGIILRSVKYSETSLIIDVFTEAKGLRSYIVSGVRTPKAKVSTGLLQVMALVDMVCYDKEDSHKLSRIKEIRAGHIYTSLPFDMHKAAVGLFMIEVARRSIKEPEEHQALFSFLYDIFTYLDTASAQFINLHLAYMIYLSGYLGFQPHLGAAFQAGKTVFDLKEGVFTEATVGHTYFINTELTVIFKQLIDTDWQESHTVKMTREERRQLLRGLVMYFQLHIENIGAIHSLDILQEIF